MDFVDYLTKGQEKWLIDWHPFIKKSIFEHQNEFRVTFVSDTDKPVKLDLGCTLRDIVVPIKSSDLNEIFF